MNYYMKSAGTRAGRPRCADQLCPLDWLQCDAPPEEACIAHQRCVLGIHGATLESRHIRLLGAKSGCDLLLTEPLTLSFRSELPNQPPSFDGCLHKLREIRVHRSPPRDEVVQIVFLPHGPMMPYLARYV